MPPILRLEGTPKLARGRRAFPETLLTPSPSDSRDQDLPGALIVRPSTFGFLIFGLGWVMGDPLVVGLGSLVIHITRFP